MTLQPSPLSAQAGQRSSTLSTIRMSSSPARKVDEQWIISVVDQASTRHAARIAKLLQDQWIETTDDLKSLQVLEVLKALLHKLIVPLGLDSARRQRRFRTAATDRASAYGRCPKETTNSRCDSVTVCDQP